MEVLLMKDNIRIVSLIPSGTEILSALGLTEKIVGRSHECDYPPEIEKVPVCTQARFDTSAHSGEIHDKVNHLLQDALSIYQIKTDILEKLQPTHIVTQDQCDVCAVSLKEVEEAVATLTDNSPVIISLQPNILSDVWSDLEKIGHMFDVDSVKVIENLEARVKIVQQRTKGLSATEALPTVACIEWTDPLMVAANWIPELVELAGGKPLFGITGQNSSQLRWESLIASNPDVIIFMPCGFDLNRARTDAQLLANRPEWQALHATQTGRVYVTDGNAYFNRPGPRLVESLEILADVLHPEIFQYGYKGKGWELL
jgi:iron complex transport system substrate-binding protein